MNPKKLLLPELRGVQRKKNQTHIAACSGLPFAQQTMEAVFETYVSITDSEQIFKAAIIQLVRLNRPASSAQQVIAAVAKQPNIA